MCLECINKMFFYSLFPIFYKRLSVSGSTKEQTVTLKINAFCQTSMSKIGSLSTTDSKSDLCLRNTKIVLSLVQYKMFTKFNLSKQKKLIHISSTFSPTSKEVVSIHSRNPTLSSALHILSIPRQSINL